MLELVAAFIRRREGDSDANRREAAGDAAEVCAKTDRAREVLGWEAKFSIEECCVDQWKWASENPYGYGQAE